MFIREDIKKYKKNRYVNSIALLSPKKIFLEIKKLRNLLI